MMSIDIRPEVCIGCGLCRVYCQTEHSRSKDPIKAFTREEPRPVSRIRVETLGEVSFAVQCRNCAEPWCVYSCLTGALRKDAATGEVTLDSTKCIGCWTCILACPYGALTRTTGHGTVAKCDLCPGLAIPACVASCPNEALMLGTTKEEATEPSIAAAGVNR
ncbi:MAG: 4Fe-4S dicluster domain-containing protein [Dehalococcoidia bacterium]